MKSISGSFTATLPLPPERVRFADLATIRWGLLAAALALSVVGAVTIRSAASELATDFFARQLVWIGVGVLVAAAAASFNYHALLAFSPPLYAAALAALVLVLFLGHAAGGDKGWFRLGTVGFQPAEFAKLATALYLARYLAGVRQRDLAFRQIATAVLIAGAPMALVAVQPDLGGAAMYAPMLGAMLLVAGVRLRDLVAGLLIAAGVAALLWNFGMRPYQRQRIETFLGATQDPKGAGYQVRQSKIAVGSGGLTGRGYMQGSQSQLRFLPARHTDFILAVLAEEWGFAGVATVLALYGVLLANAGAVALRARDRSGILLVVGLAAVVAFHVLYNSAMVIGLVPVTGIPLPFLSYGGSFLIVNFAAIGLVLGVDLRRHVNR